MIKLGVIPRGEVITRSGICFPEYREKALINSKAGVVCTCCYHVASGIFYIFGEETFDSIKPSKTDQPMVDYFLANPDTVYYCDQSKDVIKRYRKEVAFAGGLAETRPRIAELSGFDEKQARFLIWDKSQNGKLKYIKDGIIHKGLRELSAVRDNMPPTMRALASSLNALERAMYHDYRFKHN